MTDEVTRVLEEEARRTDAEGKWPELSMKAIAEAGLLGLTLPRDACGKGAGMREFAQATEQIARQCASSAMIYLMHVRRSSNRSLIVTAS
jgi:isovaleryl-CoA dehydrogenase